LGRPSATPRGTYDDRDGMGPFPTWHCARDGGAGPGGRETNLVPPTLCHVKREKRDPGPLESIVKIMISYDIYLDALLTQFRGVHSSVFDETDA
jgi:hypothetical protein